ncbi:thioredoxin-disulfide reductase [Carboxydothermus hydrogenoformans]|uniref:Thioredoxin reductase n=1 Tax=Carboxydothermus hydrogenoformans (strain ATCC BAA-161 / DSM 6008 / Z-2901) TaxID=246194 RepID=Q3AEL6_CARHZ|nr:thioredoxin/thioredoxin-disulfide reductase [Carboxydothermus hydrogenoformans Z-2901]
MSDKVIYLSQEQFDEVVLKSDVPVIVDFYSEDCPPCEALAPAYEKLAQQYGDKFKFVKIYRQQNRPLAEKLGVKGSPTVLFYVNGQEVGQRLTGYISKRQLREAMEKAFGQKLLPEVPETVKYDVIVLGGGPAGLSAALYTARAKLRTIVVDESVPGGQAATTYHIANYPGTPGTIRGKELTQNMLNQALAFGAEVDDLKEVLKVELTGEVKRVITEDKIYEAPAIILATGAEPRKLPAEGEDLFRGRGVHYCATCDGAMYQGMKVVVVGGGNSAVEEAVFLTRFATEVTIIHQFDHFQASKVAQEEAFANPKIKVIWDSEVRKVVGDKHVTGVVIENLKTKELSTVPTDGVFVYIGTQPKTNLFAGQVEMNEWGYIITDEEMRTNIPGVFAAGDLRQKSVRQAVTAAADGVIAAVNVERYLASKK